MELLSDGRIKIENNPISTNFLRHKFTFHTSGYIHSTQKNGERFKDGIRGIPFSDIETSNLILLLAPKEISLLEKYKAKKNGHNFIIPLADEQQSFTLNFEVFRKSCLNNLPNVPKEIEQGPFSMQWDFLRFGLRFYIQKIEGKPTWPKSSLVLKRIMKRDNELR
ncbi:hypothetical protein EZV76_16705 [Flagellimonas alvinocaridis]|uniref:Uncharacterized protein n=1 Tax=Flagellimonas alvinocaridis TaxID=2530200 RepID=A0A4S8RJ50_9FLAO|nr:hypothetical protein [Allomuricauda alvinocaridis]THV56795.1 hypothetical protein EZV76_16705 [Allomuricauda alvinocaridis]